MDIPVVAAGGSHDGRGPAAALAYGAAGIAMGTRFPLTSDSTVPDAVKARHLAAAVTDVTGTTAVGGLPRRMLRGELVDSLERSGRTAAPPHRRTAAPPHCCAPCATPPPSGGRPG